MVNLPQRLRESGQKIRRSDWFKLFFYHLKNRLWDGYPVFSRNITSAPPDPRRILVIQLSSIGDVTYTIPALFSLQKVYPDAKIDFICESECALGVVGHPAINKLWEIPTLRWLNTIVNGNQGEPIGELRGLLRELQQCGYDFIINLHSSPCSAILTELISSPHKSGLIMGEDLVASIAGNPLNLLRFYSLKKETGKIPLRSASVHSLLVAPGGSGRLDYYARSEPEIKTRIEKLYENNHVRGRHHILINTGSRMAGRRWEAKHCTRVILELLNEDIEIGLIGGGGDIERLEEIKRLTGEHPNIICWYEKTQTLLEDIILSDFVDLTITSDSGPLHLISIRNNRCLDLAGDMWVGPWNEESRVIQSDNKRISAIEPDFIAKTVSNMLASKQLPAAPAGVNTYRLRPERSNFFNKFLNSEQNVPTPAVLRKWLIGIFSLRLWLDKTRHHHWPARTIDNDLIKNIYSSYWPNSLPPQLSRGIDREDIIGYQEIDFTVYDKTAGQLISNWLEKFYNSQA
ncbi:MAG: glycosyltransferase family 9 protein [bacterium]